MYGLSVPFDYEIWQELVSLTHYQRMAGGTACPTYCTDLGGSGKSLSKRTDGSSWLPFDLVFFSHGWIFHFVP